MDVRKIIPKNGFYRAIVLLVIVGLVIILLNIVLKSESQLPVTSSYIRFPADSKYENATYGVWAKTVHTSSGLFPLKTDSYNVVAISLYPHGYWLNGRWAIPIQIAGVGATRSYAGLLMANGLKTITLDSEQSLDVHSFTTTNLYGNMVYYPKMLSNATRDPGDKSPSKYSSLVVMKSTDYLTSFSGKYLIDQNANRFTTTYEKWQYSDLTGGDSTDAVYALDTYSECDPGSTEDIRFITTFSWGLLQSSKNEITLRISVPPNPESMTQEQLDKYGIRVYTYKDNGQTRKGYSLDRVTSEAF